MTLKVLIIDDNRDICSSVRQILTAIDSNYEVLEAHDGPEGLKKVKAKKPDIVLLDVMMPGMDGGQVGVALKENPETRKIPVLFLTAKTDKLTKGMGAIVGDDFIEKPFEGVDLDRRIKAQLKKVK